MADEKEKNGKEEKIEKEIESEEEKELEKEELEAGKKVISAEISEEMRSAYIDYAMSVIVARALPSVEDGLKPVHRRILYAMEKLGLDKGQTKKCARIVGDVLGKFHPHGDMAVYDALVRMAQDFSLRYPLIIGQGNFGSLDNDPAAAQRYTEAKLDPISMELLEDIDKDTVKMLPNFDNSLKEPETLPGKLPNLLINGATGIAVGMATNIPPHNLTEVCDAITTYINNPDITIEKLCEIVQGPDFPTGGYVSGDLIEFYKTGKGKLIMRGKTTTEEHKGKESIIITEIPYMLSKADLVTEIANLVQEKKLPDISDLRDESAKGKIRIVIDLRKGADSKFTLNRLYKFTRLQNNFDANMIALVGNRPRTLNLKNIIEEYIKYRKIIVERRTKFDLKKAEDRLEIVLGLLIALKSIDDVVILIRKSKNASEALESLINKFKLTKNQSQAILDMKLSSLTNLENEKLVKEENDLKTDIIDLKKIISSSNEILNVIKKEVSELKRKYGDTRRTYVLQREVSDISEQDMVQKKEVAVMITDKGYAKRMDIKTYKEQKRGGKGVIGSDLSTGDFVKQMLTCSTHDYLMLFTSKGRVYWLKAYEIPAAERYSKGKALINLVALKDETIQSIMAVKEFKDFLMIVTKKGQVKKMPLALLSKPRASGVRVINLPMDNSDSVIDVKLIKEKHEVLLVTKEGQAIRFNSDEVRSMGRASYGVAGIKLEKTDVVVSLEVLDDPKSTILTVTEKGYGKRSTIEDYRLTGRACKGVINLKVSDKTKGVVTTIAVKDEDSAIATTAKGMVIRVPCKDIRVMGRATQGVRIIKLHPDDSVTDIVKIVELEE
jgi:DNA gyrase subunit A